VHLFLINLNGYVNLVKNKGGYGTFRQTHLKPLGREQTHKMLNASH